MMGFQLTPIRFGLHFTQMKINREDPLALHWIHELARSEFVSEAEREKIGARWTDPQQLIHQSAQDFLIELRDLFQEYARVFNSYSEAGKKFSEIKLYSLAQTSTDFLLFRNLYKMIISQVAIDTIHLSFVHHERGMLSIDGRGTPDVQSYQMGEAKFEFSAQIGAFRDIVWTYQGERISPVQIARYFFMEFVRISHEQKPSPVNQAELISHIRSILNEQGLSL